jgi:hypothetical protein
VSRPRKLLEKARQNPAGLRFEEADTLARRLGFRHRRTSGSHHIYARDGIPELVNLQDVGGKAKAYQVRQLLDLVDRYALDPGSGK